MAASVSYWGSLWAWSTFDYEDAIGYYRNLIHGSNNLDIELANSMVMINSYYILKDLLKLDTNNDTFKFSVLGKPFNYRPSENEISALQLLPISYSFLEDHNSIPVYFRAVKGKEIFTSTMYARQKKRFNKIVAWGDPTKFGIIQYFILKNSEIYAVVQELVRNYQEKIYISSENIDFSSIIIPTQKTYSIMIVPLREISKKLIVVTNYVCVSPNLVEKK